MKAGQLEWEKALQVNTQLERKLLFVMEIESLIQSEMQN